MSILVAAAHVVGLVVALGWLVRVGRARDRMIAEIEELYRWRTGWEQARRWMDEFGEVAIALDHLQGFAYGREGVDIVRTREKMRAHSYFVSPRSWVVLNETGPVTAQAAAAREKEFRVDYKHLSAECSDET